MADRKATLHTRARLSNVAIAAPTHFEQELDIWSEIADTQQEENTRKKSNQAEVKTEKDEAALHRKNLVKRFSDKWSFCEVVDGIEELSDLDTLHDKMRKIAEY